MKPSPEIRLFFFGTPSNPPRWVDRAPLWLVLPVCSAGLLAGGALVYAFIVVAHSL